MKSTFSRICLCLLLAIVLAVGVSSCHTRPVETAPPTPTAPEVTPTPEPEEVKIAGLSVPADSRELELPAGSYSYEELCEALSELPELNKLSLPGTELTMEELSEISSENPELELSYSVKLGDVLVPMDTRTLDLSKIQPEELGGVVLALKRLPELESIELMNAEGGTSLSLTDARALKMAAPQAALSYEFELFGKQVSTSDERIEFDKEDIGPEGLPRIREALDIMPDGTYLKLADCGIDSETMAALRDEYPTKKIVWRVRFGDYFSCLTDEETIRAIFKLHNDDCSELKYCTDVKYMDIGHNPQLTVTDFIAYMPKLEICILSGSYFDDLTPFENCPNLQFLELVWCGNVKDLSPLEKCTKLEYLNISYAQVDDLRPLDELPLVRFCYYTSRIPAAQQEEFRSKHPDCWTNFTGLNPYVLGWRYDDQGYTWCDMYLKVREVFRYSENFYNKS